MSELSTTLVRTIIIYFILIFSMRIMGKRQLGEMELSELVTTLVFSEIAAVPITDFRIPLKRAVIPMLIIISLEIILPFVTGKKRAAKKLLEGKPSYLIYKGELRMTELTKSRISLDELICELRTQGYFDISDIEYAILESNGKISLLPKNGDTTCQNISGMVHSLILNGEIIDFTMKLLNIEHSWLDKKLEALNLSVKDVTLFGVDDDMNIVSVISKKGQNANIVKSPSKNNKKAP